MRYTAGIDIGTALTKAVIVSGGNGEAPRILGRGMLKTGVHLEKAAAEALASARDMAHLPAHEALYVVSTGFGRYSPSFRDTQVTEITSAARGAWFLFPDSPTVLDVGSQSTRAVGLAANGRVRAFKTNDKCAAGSGSFIVRAAKYLQVDMSKVGELALQAGNPQPISSICAVLAESEIINHVSAGVTVEDILGGIYDSLASRAGLLLKRVNLGEQLTFIGGVARQRGMIKALEQRLHVKVNVPEHCEFVCALGAALLGLSRLEKAAAAAVGTTA
ncbi:MAG TPA: acyl-CoA dehydratase activase [Terriglobales bacterium]|nr:acyl-CoA dehydratase activase [Terriglobales bacterium]